ncbi:DUF1330 domain-containing protein [Muricauda sp. 2012CJ35-5]|uniref:DUF1330 domain-containing protein n=1 Tax=Flagellimonas spongiicola TaxID=2942208 RepID=A0ABT0PPN8_9FLAO|nr:DUF1330 domain-containing protein [Allomuricauda spongiicola]MCL6273357.1 DUF1330 domain-containing protein [Allomuricauda spongiicola]
MTYYSVLDVTPTSEEWIANYLPAANELVIKHGGKYLARTTSHEQLEGDNRTASLRILLEWPSKEAAIAFMQDPEYLPHLEARTKGSISHHYVIAGKDDLA